MTIKKKVVTGGTFEALHEGHKALLRRAFELGEATIGLTSDQMAQEAKKRKVRSFAQRKRALDGFIKKEFAVSAKIVKIEDRFGPTLKEDFDCIVVSPETLKTALLINRERRKIKKNPIKIVKIDFVRDRNGKPVSSTELLRAGASGFKETLLSKANPRKAKILQKFFKTGKGEYGEGDIFLGVTVPEIRKTAKKFKNAKAGETEELLKSGVHEERMLALLILIRIFKDKKSSQAEKKEIYGLYLKNTKFINNWDLVDLSADKIIGEYLRDKQKGALLRLARSKNLWERRMSVMATFNFIKKGRFEETFKIAKMLLNDKEPLIHKALGWMLREIGKRDLAAEEKFLEKFCRRMPRIMLTYALEKFSDSKRKYYLKR